MAGTKLLIIALAKMIRSRYTILLSKIFVLIDKLKFSVRKLRSDNKHKNSSNNANAELASVISKASV